MATCSFKIPGFKPCHRKAGWGTEHEGVGHCVDHGGLMESHRALDTPEISTERQDLIQQILVEHRGRRRYGSADWIDPEQAIVNELARANGAILYIETALAQLQAKYEEQQLENKALFDQKENPTDILVRGDEEVPDMAGWLAEPRAQQLLTLYDVERDRLIKVSKLCLDIGLAERRLELAEQVGLVVVQSLLAVADRLELTPLQREKLPELVAAQVHTYLEVPDVIETTAFDIDT